jgi:hypothetical protein
MAMSKEFKFLVIDANQAVEPQQTIVRELVGQHIELGEFKRNGIARIDEFSSRRSNMWKHEEAME